MKTLILLLFAVSCFIGSSSAQDKPKPIDVKSFAGKYSFNPTCTDEMATVNIAFRKARKGEYGTWRADGTLDNNFHGTTIDFTSAFVEVNEDGSVTVDAQFFAFKLTGRTLEWLPNYDRPLFKVVNGVLQDQQ